MIAADLTPRLSRLVGSARILWLSLAVTGSIALLVPLAQPGWWIALLTMSSAAGEFARIVFATPNVSPRQRRCP